MAKKTRKEIEQTLRNKIANKHNEEREYQQNMDEIAVIKKPKELEFYTPYLMPPRVQMFQPQTGQEKRRKRREMERKRKKDQ